MPLINRFARLVSADLNALLDRIEEPEVLLRQAVREMAEELDAMRRRAQVLGAERERVQRERSDIAALLPRLGTELELCLDADEQALARDLVRRRLASERRQADLAHQDEQLDATVALLDAAIRGAEGELGAMQEKLDLAGATATYAAVPTPTTSTPTISEAEIDIALLAARRQRAPR
ncbi:MAG: PspA/IM30 family protein [Gammaproteobacteria bacterium]